MKGRRYQPVPGHKLGFMPTPEEIARLMSKALVHQYHDLPEGVSGACWLYPGAPDKDGYGMIKLRGKTYRVHRVSFAMFNHDSGEGLHIDHLCLHRKCFNPAHLVAKSMTDNTTEANNRRWAQHRAAQRVEEPSHAPVPDGYGVTVNEECSAPF